MAEYPNRRLSREVEEAIQDYLGKIGQRLKSSGTDAAESQAILGDLETQIRTLLAEKGPAPTWNDLTAVLSKMDSPDKFSMDREPVRRIRSPAMIAALAGLVASSSVRRARLPPSLRKLVMWRRIVPDFGSSRYRVSSVPVTSFRSSIMRVASVIGAPVQFSAVAWPSFGLPT